MELQRSSSIISDPIRLVLQAEAAAEEAEEEAAASKAGNQSHGHRHAPSSSTSIFTKPGNRHHRGKAKAIGGTSSINSSHYVDFCTDPTTGFPEFQPKSSNSNNNSIYGQKGGGINKILSPWADMLLPSSSDSESSHPPVVVQADDSSVTAPPPRTTTLHPSICPSPEPIACLQAPNCPDCSIDPRGGPDSLLSLSRVHVPLSTAAAPSQVRPRPSPCTFSSTSFSLKPWQWPRRSKPATRTRWRLGEDSGALSVGSRLRLSFSQPYSYFGFGRWRRGQTAATPAAAAAQASSHGHGHGDACSSSSSSGSSDPAAISGGGADCSCSSSFVSSSHTSHISQSNSTSTSHSSHPSSIPCQVHDISSPVRIRSTPATAANTTAGAAASPYYYLRKYGTSTTTAAIHNDYYDKNDEYSCCKKLKYKSRSSWSWWKVCGSTGGGGVGGKHHPYQMQALRTFQLISILLCVLGIVTLLVITILSSIARSGLDIISDGGGDDSYNDEQTPLHRLYGSGSGVSLIDNLLVANSGGDIEPEPTPTIQDQLRTWLYGGSRGRRRDYESMPPEMNDSLLNVTHFKFLLNNEQMCEQHANRTAGFVSDNENENDNSPEISTTPMPPSRLYFMILVHSAPKHFQQRQAIRSTWGSVKSVRNLGIRLVFLLGQPANRVANSTTIKFTRNNPRDLLQRSIYAEQALYGDIVQGNFPDTYRNLIYKHLMGYKWILRYCDGRHTTFVLKTDDDVFIDIFQLIDFTTRHYGLQPSDTIICNVYQGTFPVRASRVANASLEPLSKWAVSMNEYPLPVYPKYCGGLAYLITPDVIRRLLAVHERIMTELTATNRTLQFWIDDVYVTGVLRELDGRQPYYMNLRYAYDPKLYQPWMLTENDEDSPTVKLKQGDVAANVVQIHESDAELEEELDVKPVAPAHKIPYMIVHLEQTKMLSEEMNRLWRKTMRVWH